jgi:hypothetical protein
LLLGVVVYAEAGEEEVSFCGVGLGILSQTDVRFDYFINPFLLFILATTLATVLRHF